ncbi:hypothetical protein VCR3J2_270017 [Vibrio coralliirubri]|nr:hypothetical protein VCR3J2_270017 [Vibrio coralliirubri]
MCLSVSFNNSKAYINMTLQSVKDRISCRKTELGSVYKKDLALIYFEHNDLTVIKLFIILQSKLGLRQFSP